MIGYTPSSASREIGSCSTASSASLTASSERHRTRELGVLGLVYNTHAPAAEVLKDLVVGNDVADHRRRLIGSIPLIEWVLDEYQS